MAKKKSMKELVAYAKKRAKEHHRYKTGARNMSWKTYFDCHWFVKNVFKDCGYPEVYKRITGNYWRKPWGKKYLGKYLVLRNRKGIDKKKLLPGDIVIKHLTHHNGYHSALYIGNGKIAHTTSGRGYSHIAKITKNYTHAFRVPEPHKEVYEVIRTRKLRKSWSSKSKMITKLKPETKFKTDQKRGNWVRVVKVYNEKTDKWKKCKGWACIKHKNKAACKKSK